MESQLSLITMLNLLRIDILNCKSQLDIVDCSLGIVPPRFFALNRVISLVFLNYHFLCYLLFLYVCYMR